MTSSFRKYARLGLALSWILSFFAIRFLAKAFHPISKAAERRIRKFAFRVGSRGLVRITGMRVEVRGAAPEPPFFLVCNHLTFLDVFVLASQLGCVFVSRDDLARWPVFGYVVRHMNTIFINRERLRDTVRVNELLTDAMNDGFGVVVFPESQVSTEGVVLPFKPALLQPAVELGMHVHYATVHYRTPEGSPPASEIVVWHDGVSFFGHYLDVAGLPRCDAILTFGDTPIPGGDRKALAEDLHAAVRAQFVPLD